MPTITREQLLDEMQIRTGRCQRSDPEVGADCREHSSDPAIWCDNCVWREAGVRFAALATPDTLPPVAVGDYVDLDGFGLCYVPTAEAARVLSGGSDGLKAVYRPLWQRGKE